MSLASQQTWRINSTKSRTSDTIRQTIRRQVSVSDFLPAVGVRIDPCRLAERVPAVGHQLFPLVGHLLMIFRTDQPKYRMQNNLLSVTQKSVRQSVINGWNFGR